jgi:hypothetical protein
VNTAAHNLINLMNEKEKISEEDIFNLRQESRKKLASVWEDICEKYCQPFEDESDVIDFSNDQIVVNKGFMEKIGVIGFGLNESDDEEEEENLNEWTSSDDQTSKEDKPVSRKSLAQLFSDDDEEGGDDDDDDICVDDELVNFESSDKEIDEKALECYFLYQYYHNKRIELSKAKDTKYI